MQHNILDFIDHITFIVFASLLPKKKKKYHGTVLKLNAMKLEIEVSDGFGFWRNVILLSIFTKVFMDIIKE